MNDHLALLEDPGVLNRLYPIYIPSYSRAGAAPLLNFLETTPRLVQSLVTIVVREEQWNDYHAAYPWANLTIVRRPGLGPARTHALNHAALQGLSRIVMMDDDINHISLLERISREGKSDHTRRYSSRVSGLRERQLLPRSLSVACMLADAVFAAEPDAVYGACRNALFSGDVDTRVGATLNKGTFPASVMFYDLTRMENYELPGRFHMHGEDIAFAMDVMTRGQDWFTLPVVAFDQDGNIQSTIPLDPHDPQARRVDIENAAVDYPLIYPYLRESVKNKAGGVMRVGVNWKRWYRDTNSAPIEIPLDQLIKEN